MSNYRKALVAAAIGTLALTPLAACSSNDSNASSNVSAAAATQPAPVAQVDNLTGVSTAVALDSGFTGALTTLGLTP